MQTYLFDRILSLSEDNAKLADSFIYNMNERDRMVEARHIVQSLAKLNHEQVYMVLPKPDKGSNQADPFGSLLRILIKASSDNYAHEIVDKLLIEQETIAPNNKLVWVFIALAAKPKHKKMLEKVVRRSDLIGDENIGIPRHNRTLLFLGQAIDRFRSKQHRRNKYILEEEVTGLHGVASDGIYNYKQC